MTRPDLPAHDHPGTVWGLPPARAALQLSGLVYLATPYTKRAAPGGVFDWGAADDAYRDALGALAAMERLGITAVSPIVQAHLIVRRHASAMGPQGAARLALDADHWMRWCAPMLAACRAVYVPAIAGWDQSAGIAFEVAEALDRNKPVIFEGVLE